MKIRFLLSSAAVSLFVVIGCTQTQSTGLQSMLPRLSSSHPATQQKLSLYSTQSNTLAQETIQNHSQSYSARGFFDREDGLHFRAASEIALNYDADVAAEMEMHTDRVQNFLSSVAAGVLSQGALDGNSPESIFKVKLALDAAVAASAPRKQYLYNRAATTLTDIVELGRGQCSSGTFMLAMALRQALGAEAFRHGPWVMIYRPVHVLMGYIDGGHLNGVETTSNGRARYDFGPVSALDWSEFRIVDAELALAVDAVKFGTPDLASLSEQALQLTNEKFSLSQPTKLDEATKSRRPRDFLRRWVGNNWTPFVLPGVDPTPSGDIERISFDFVKSYVDPADYVVVVDDPYANYQTLFNGYTHLFSLPFDGYTPATSDDGQYFPAQDSVVGAWSVLNGSLNLDLSIERLRERTPDLRDVNDHWGHSPRLIGARLESIRYYRGSREKIATVTLLLSNETTMTVDLKLIGNLSLYFRR